LGTPTSAWSINTEGRGTTKITAKQIKCGSATVGKAQTAGRTWLPGVKLKQLASSHQGMERDRRKHKAVQNKCK
jgi:hypothetical protein